MRKKRIIFTIIMIVFYLILTSCRFPLSERINELGNDTAAVTYTEKYGKMIFSHLINAIENKDKDKFVELFSAEAQNKVISDDLIDDVFDFYKGKSINTDYNASVETTIFEMGEMYKYDECLGFVKTNEETYSIEFLALKNKGSEGIISLIISTEKKRENQDYAEFVIKTFDEASYFNKNYYGVFIF